jgi:hypothetical protein
MVKLALEKLADFVILEDIVGVLAPIGVPARLPGFNDPQSQSDGINFLAQAVLPFIKPILPRE